MREIRFSQKNKKYSSDNVSGKEGSAKWCLMCKVIFWWCKIETRKFQNCAFRLIRWKRGPNFVRQISTPRFAKRADRNIANHFPRSDFEKCSKNVCAFLKTRGCEFVFSISAFRRFEHYDMSNRGFSFIRRHFFKNEPKFPI